MKTQIMTVGILLAFAGCATATRLTCNQSCALQDLSCAEATILGLHNDFIPMSRKGEVEGGVVSGDTAGYRCVQPRSDEATRISDYAKTAREIAKKNPKHP